jgi:hypothetical protein
LARQRPEHGVDTAPREAEFGDVRPRQQRLRHRQPLVELALPLGHAVAPELP